MFSAPVTRWTLGQVSDVMLGASIKGNMKWSIVEGISIHNYFVCYCVFCDVSVYFQSFISTISPSLKVSLLRVLRWDGGLSRSLLWSFLLMWKCAAEGASLESRHLPVPDTMSGASHNLHPALSSLHRHLQWNSDKLTQASTMKSLTG